MVRKYIVFNNFENWGNNLTGGIGLIQWSLTPPYGAIGLGQHWLRWRLAAWRNQNITQTNIDLAWVRFTDIHHRTIAWERIESLMYKICLKITNLRYHSNLPGVNELIVPHPWSSCSETALTNMGKCIARTHDYWWDQQNKTKHDKSI